MKDLIVAFLAMAVVGCTSQYGKPTDITLESALTSVGTGLAGMRAAERGAAGSGGLVPSEVVITFNVAASATDSGSLAIQASAPTGAPINASANASAATTQTASRGNQITITLTNLLFAPPNLIADNPDTVDKLLTTLHNHHYDVYVVDEQHVDPQSKAQVDALLDSSRKRLQALSARQK